MIDTSKPKQRRTGKPHAEVEITWTHTPRIDPGEYPAFCRSANIYRDGQFKRWVCAVQFDVLTSDISEVLARLTWFLNLGDGETPHATRRKNYWRAWVAANGSQPKRKDRLAPRVFARRYARVIVADTTKDFKQTAVTRDGAYSVIRRVVSWESGGGQ